ncbi:MAG: haloacid dehalogenase-like hydrolase [Marinilabiliales bacterium]|nr:MAG: haloacid dehalogenase-like hydrolase [Marinilabiliales bacterium]
MSAKQVRAAIAYDFDGTLSPGNMQEHSFLPKLGIPKNVFWSESNRIAKENDMDGILAYMQLMLRKSAEKGIPVRRSDFVGYGREIRFYPGVEKYFELINEYAGSQGILLDHHIISSGLREFIEGTPIARNFRNIFASGFKYDENGIAEWPALAINYTNKTQYLFRINKGIDNSWDNERINRFTPEARRPVPFSRMIYIGDGETDVPAMKMLKYQGGATIAVYNPESRSTAESKSQEDLCRDLIAQNRVDYTSPADYREGSSLVRTIKLLIDRIGINSRLDRDIS